ncbi:MAG: aspartate carbamoyltransferase [Phycisphaerae bacterium]
MSGNPEDPSQMPTAHRVALLSRDDRLFHVILAQQFDRPMMQELCRLAEMIRSVAEVRSGAQFLRTLLGHKRAMLYFIQPSTRTFLSFAAACQILGMPYNEVRNPSTSSEIKGETEDDTIRVLSQYFDVIVMRHPAEGFAERMAHVVNRMRRSIPIINGGSGKDQHPTQALLDIYTLYRNLAYPSQDRPSPDFSMNPFEGKTIAFVGDLKRGRTVRSLAYLLCRFPDVRMLFVSHPDLQIGADIIEYIERNDVNYELHDDVRAVIDRCDAVYMTRLQDEWDTDGESTAIDYGKYTLTLDLADRFKKNMVIMHPLPRRHEIDKRLDDDPRAKYFSQVRNGMWMRAALIATTFNVDARIIDHYHSYYAR